MELPFTSSQSSRPRLHLPNLQLQNALLESSPGGPTANIRTTRPGLTYQYDLDDGPIYEMYQEPGVFNGDLFTVSGSGVYRNQTLIGTVASSNSPQMLYGDGYLVVVSGGSIYTYDGTTFQTIQFFSDGVSLIPPIQGMVVIYSVWFYFLESSQQFFFSNPGDPTKIDAGNYSAAQVYPDNIVQMTVLGEQVYIFKNTSTEIWQYVGALLAPLQEIQGATWVRGAVSQNCIHRLNNTLLFVGDDLQVYLVGGPSYPQIISTPIINDRLLNEATIGSPGGITALAYTLEGHPTYIINLPVSNESYAFDLSTNEWSRFGTTLPQAFTPGQYIGGVSSGVNSTPIYIGSYVDGKIYTLDVNNNTDDGVPIQVTVGAVAWTSGKRGRCNNLTLRCVRGQGSIDNPAPLVAMRYSDDGGQTYSSWILGQYGPMGQYGYKTTWRSLGFIVEPGRLFDFRISDPVLRVIEGVTMNEGRP